jgi:hypothetical protein
VTSEPEFAGFARLIDSLSPWLEQVVIIGGWAHRLYRLHPSAQALDYPALTTLDTDVALPARLEVKEQDIHERLLANGFHEEFLGEDRPPATHYHLGGESSEFYAEFLTPLVGSAYSRRGRSNATARIGGVSSQRLRYIELLLNSPWQVTLDQSTVLSATGQFRVRVANPVAFIVQKMLIYQKRSPLQRAKDILYIHDTLQTFGARLDELRAEWQDSVRPLLPAKGAHVADISATLFEAMSDPIRAAALMGVGRTLSAEAIRETCAFGLGRIFG